MSFVQLSEGVSRCFTSLACGPGSRSPELSFSDMAIARKILVPTFTSIAFSCVSCGPYGMVMKSYSHGDAERDCRATPVSDPIRIRKMTWFLQRRCSCMRHALRGAP